MIEQGKIVETKQLKIYVNTFIYDNAIIQTDNISRISISPMAKRKVPSWAFICMLLGLVLVGANTLIGILLLCAGVGYALYIAYKNSDLGHYLALELNSGNVLYFSGKDSEFLNRIMRTLGDCMNNKKGGYIIDMGKATITNMQIGDYNNMI